MTVSYISQPYPIVAVECMKTSASIADSHIWTDCPA